MPGLPHEPALGRLLNGICSSIARRLPGRDTGSTTLGVDLIHPRKQLVHLCQRLIHFTWMRSSGWWTGTRSSSGRIANTSSVYESDGASSSRSLVSNDDARVCERRTVSSVFQQTVMVAPESGKLQSERAQALHTELAGSRWRRHEPMLNTETEVAKLLD